MWQFQVNNIGTQPCIHIDTLVPVYETQYFLSPLGFSGPCWSPCPPSLCASILVFIRVVSKHLSFTLSMCIHWAPVVCWALLSSPVNPCWLRANPCAQLSGHGGVALDATSPCSVAGGVMALQLGCRGHMRAFTSLRLAVLWLVIICNPLFLYMMYHFTQGSWDTLERMRMIKRRLSPHDQRLREGWMCRNIPGGTAVRGTVGWSRRNWGSCWTSRLIWGKGKSEGRW